MAASEILVEIGKRLYEQRKKMGLTQEETADLLVISATFYGAIERGRKRLSIERMILVYRRMGLDPTYLLTGELPRKGELDEVFRKCPKEKRETLERILEDIGRLY